MGRRTTNVRQPIGNPFRLLFTDAKGRTVFREIEYESANRIGIVARTNT